MLDTLPDNGTWHITCKDAIEFDGKAHDVIFEWRRRDGVWDRECIARTPTLVSSLHEFHVERKGDTDAAVQFRGRIDPDPWTTVAGPMTLTVPASADRYEGTFGVTAIRGAVEAPFETGPHPSRGVARGELDILKHYEQQGAAGRLYDFSHAGRGTTDHSDTLAVFDACDYGVEPDSGKEATEAIQRALDAAGEAGGGVVRLPAGVMDMNVERRLPALRIRHSNVVLRGAGNGPDGTVLVNHRYHDTPVPGKLWLAGVEPMLIIGDDIPLDDGPAPAAMTQVTAGQRGGMTIDVADAAALEVGQSYLLRQLEVDDGSLARDLVHGLVEVANNYRGAGAELVSQLFTVLGIDGNTITLDAPLHRGISDWPAEVCRFDLIERSGVADLRLRCLWGGYFIHHKNGEHDNGWDHVKFHRVRYGFAHDLVHENTTSAVGFRDTLGCVARHCSIMGNPGHNGLVVTGRCTGNLIANCHCGRNMHGFNMQGTVCGNAFVDCTMDEPSGIDLHGGTCLDNLYDSMVGGVNKGGGSNNAVPPRHSNGLVLWNWCCGHYNPYKVWQRFAFGADMTMPGFIAVGVHGMYGQRIDYKTPKGVTSAATQEDWGWIESPGQRVAPRSLHAWQCARRASAVAAGPR